MLSGTPQELLRKHINGDFERDVRSMNILYEIILDRRNQLLIVAEQLEIAKCYTEAIEFRNDIHELDLLLFSAWPIVMQQKS